ncbi:MAG: hypothetical protein NT004_13260 [Bacteroidetes bacterium]|nr:hypothetical protein [Bacteroidota bacterium]
MTKGKPQPNSFTFALFCEGFLLVFFSIGGFVNGQEVPSVKSMEQELSRDFFVLKNTHNDSARFKLNDTILSLFHSVLSMPSAACYSFDSLKTIARITSDDKRFTIFHWNIQRENGRHRYYGFLRINDGTKSKIFQLVDFSDSLAIPDSLILDSGHWFGALYYRVITGTTSTGKTFYTLLGWSGEDALITSKVIEILTFNAADEPIFGLPVFKEYPGGMKTRIIFRYSSSATMALKYEEQIVSTGKKWNSRKRIFEITNTLKQTIVVDQLIPLDSTQEGQYQYYFPAGDMIDGFYMDYGRWRFIQGIESRNKPR